MVLDGFPYFEHCIYKCDLCVICELCVNCELSVQGLCWGNGCLDEAMYRYVAIYNVSGILRHFGAF